MPRTPAPQVADAGFETSSAPRRVPSGPPRRRARCSFSVLGPRPRPAGPVAFPSAANGRRSHRVTTCVVTCDHDDDVIRVALSLSTPPPQPWKSMSDDNFRKVNPGKQPDHGQFLGMSQWTEGFDPVYVSWFCDDNWRLGMDQLFHSPKKARRRR